GQEPVALGGHFVARRLYTETSPTPAETEPFSDLAEGGGATLPHRRADPLLSLAIVLVIRAFTVIRLVIRSGRFRDRVGDHRWGCGRQLRCTRDRLLGGHFAGHRRGLGRDHPRDR